MIIAWIVITLMLAVVAGIILAGLADRGEGWLGFVIGFGFVCRISILIAVALIAGHFVSKYW